MISRAVAFPFPFPRPPPFFHFHLLPSSQIAPTHLARVAGARGHDGNAVDADVVNVVQLAAVKVLLVGLVRQALDELQRAGALQRNVQQRVGASVPQRRENGLALHPLKRHGIVNAHGALDHGGNVWVRQRTAHDAAPCSPAPLPPFSAITNLVDGGEPGNVALVVAGIENHDKVLWAQPVDVGVVVRHAIAAQHVPVAKQPKPGWSISR